MNISNLTELVADEEACKQCAQYTACLLGENVGCSAKPKVSHLHLVNGRVYYNGMMLDDREHLLLCKSCLRFKEDCVCKGEEYETR